MNAIAMYQQSCYMLYANAICYVSIDKQKSGKVFSTVLIHFVFMGTIFDQFHCHLFLPLEHYQL